MIGELHTLVAWAVVAAAAVLAGQASVAVMHRYTQLSLANLYLPLGALGLATAGSLAIGSHTALIVCVIALASVTAMVVTGRRRRLQALGGGGELREYELARRMIWQPARFGGRPGSESGLVGRARSCATSRGARTSPTCRSVRAKSPEELTEGRGCRSGRVSTCSWSAPPAPARPRPPGG